MSKHGPRQPIVTNLIEHVSDTFRRVTSGESYASLGGRSAEAVSNLDLKRH